MLPRWVLAGGLIWSFGGFTSPLRAVTLSVCAKGCNYPGFQEALDAAAADCTIDTIELRAGETFTGFFHPHPRNCSATLTIQSSRWRELPPLGYRVDPARHAGLMPIVAAFDPGFPAIQFGEFEIPITAVNLTSGTIDLNGFPASRLLQLGTAITCTDTGNGVGPTLNPQPGLPGPLLRKTPYYIVEIASHGVYDFHGVKLSASPNGPPIVITDTNGVNSPSSYYYNQPFCSYYNNPKNIVLRGLDIRAADPGIGNNYSAGLVTIGGTENMPEAMPANISIQQCLLHGDPAWRDRGAPRIALWMDGRNVAVQDSYMEARAFSDETKCIQSTQGQGVLIQNNTCVSPGAMLFTGGQAGSIKEQAVQDVTVTGNLAVTAGRDVYLEGSGPPASQPCYFEYGTGAFYRDTSVAPNTCANGACYECQFNSTWAQNRSAVYRNQAFLPKARIELKNCHNCKISGNIIRGNIAGGDPGNTGCFALVLTEQSAIDSNGVFYNGHQDIRFENNWCDRVWSGILIGQSTNTVQPGPFKITGINVVDSGTIDITTDQPHQITGSYAYVYVQGISATGSLANLNGRWLYASSFPTPNTVRFPINGYPTRFDSATGTYLSGGTLQAARWPVGKNMVARNNLLTRISEFPQLSIFPTVDVSEARPLRIFDGVPGGVEVSKLTVRMDASSQPYFGVMFETVSGHGQYPTVTFKDSIISAFRAPYFEQFSPPDCSRAGYGGYFANADAMSHLLEYGPVAAWRSVPGCNSALRAEVSEDPVGFLKGEQVFVTNSKLAATSKYSAANRSAVLLSSDGTDLGADIDKIAAAISGAEHGTPAFAQRIALKITTGSHFAMLAYTAPDQNACSVKLFDARARIERNLDPDTRISADQTDRRKGNVIDGANREFVLGTRAKLRPDTEYSYELRCGEMLIPGEFRTLPEGGESDARILVKDPQADRVVVQYAANPALDKAVQVPAVKFWNGTADVRFRVSSPGVTYLRWKKLSASGTVMETSPVRAFVAPIRAEEPRVP
jgi:hypothetical protein